MYRVIPKHEAAMMSLEEKYHVINAYMRGGGIRGLIGGEDDEEYDFTPEEKYMIEEEFTKLYEEEPRFKAVIGEAKISDIPLRDKYELVIEYTKRYKPSRGREEGPMGDNDIRVEGEFVYYKGRTYKRVKIDNDEDKPKDAGDDDDDEYLMD
jgi:hypothetical protein